MSKCECCDQRGLDGTYYNEGFYCLECYYETYYYADYDEGYQLARQEIDSGTFDAMLAVMSFEQDPPDCARHYGFRRACIHEVESDAYQTD